MDLLQQVLAEPWAITEDGLETILAVAAGTVEDVRMAQAPGRHTRPTARADGVAVLPVSGTLVASDSRLARMLVGFLGGTFTADLADQFAAAMADDDVRSIVLAVDSPGGQVPGIADLAEQVYQARGHKRVLAHVRGMGTSAAYWLAAAAEEVLASPTAFLGSIGVVVGLPSQDGSRNLVRSANAPNKRLDPTTAAGLAEVQARADAVERVFVAAVARNRGTTPERVLADFGKGGTLVAEAAVRAGMADGIDTLPGTVARAAGATPDRTHVAFPTGPAGAAVMAEPNPNPPQPPAPAPAPPQPAPPQPPPPQPPALDVAHHPEVLALRQQVEALERQAAEATALRTLAEAREFFSRPDVQARVIPAESLALVPIYCRAAADDRALPARVEYRVGSEVKLGTRLEAMQAATLARPRHNLFEERTVAQVQAAFPGAAALPSGGEAEASLESLDKSTREWAARMNKNGNKAKAGA
jgi:ClpP class serine protease